MARYYVNIAGIEQVFLDFLGYNCLYEDDEFKVLWHKGDLHFIDKAKPYLYVDDLNDAELLRGAFQGREKIPLPDGHSED